MRWISRLAMSLCAPAMSCNKPPADHNHKINKDELDHTEGLLKTDPPSARRHISSSAHFLESSAPLRNLSKTYLIFKTQLTRHLPDCLMSPWSCRSPRTALSWIQHWLGCNSSGVDGNLRDLTPGPSLPRAGTQIRQQLLLQTCRDPGLSTRRP